MDLNIDYEQKFIDLLGYKIVLTSNETYDIFDEKGMKVGLIKKVLLNDSKSVSLKELYGIQMIIESENISYHNIRPLNVDLFNLEQYEFSIKQDGDIIATVELGVGNLARINIWRNELDFLNVCLGRNFLCFNYQSKTPRFDVAENIKIEINKKDKWFSYSVRYAEQELEKNCDARCETIDIKSDESIPEGILQTEVRSFVGSKLLEEKISTVKGTMLMAIRKQELAILSFNYLRNYIKDIMPFNVDIIEYLFNNLAIFQEELLYVLNNENTLKRTAKKSKLK